MKIEQYCWTKESGWSPGIGTDPDENMQLVMIFGATDALKETGLFEDLKKKVSEGAYLRMFYGGRDLQYPRVRPFGSGDLH